MPDEQAPSAETAPEVQAKGQPSDSATPPAQEADEPLGEAGLNALKKERERAARAEKELAELRDAQAKADKAARDAAQADLKEQGKFKDLYEAEAKAKADLEKKIAEMTAAQATATKRQALTDGFSGLAPLDMSAVLTLADDLFEVENGELALTQKGMGELGVATAKEAFAKYAEKKPFLFKPGAQGVGAKPMNGPNGSASAHAVMSIADPEQRRKAIDSLPTDEKRRVLKEAGLI